MQCSLLRDVINRACEFSRRDDFAQNCIFKVKSGILEVRASDGITGIYISTLVGVDIKDLSCAVNVFALQAILKAFETSADLTIKIIKNKLVIKDDEDNEAGIPVMDEDTVFYIPKPQNWLKAPDEFADKINTVKGMHFKPIKGMDNKDDDVIIIRNNDICQLARSVYVFESTETNVTVCVEAKLLQKISNDIEEYCVENNRLYLKNSNEWCMISASSKPIPKYEILFAEVQKTDNCVISIDSDVFLGFCEKLLTLKKAEEYSVLNATHSVQLEFKKGVLRGITEVGNTQIKIDNLEIDHNCAVVTDFIKAITNKQFAKEDLIEIHTGKDMRLLLAICGTTKIMGVLCRV
jgi:hypothetical protein